jgi:hypothetical protein
MKAFMVAVTLGLMTSAMSPALAADTIVTSVADLPSATSWGTIPGENRNGGERTAVTDTVAQSGKGSLELFGDRARSQIGIQYDGARTNLGLLSTARSLTFDWRIAGDSLNSLNEDLTPALRLLIQDGASNTRKELIWEGAYNNVYGPQTVKDTWYTSSASDLFYITGESVNAGKTIADWASFLAPNSTISGISVGVGSSFSDKYHAFADNVTLTTTNGSTNYNFEPAAAAVPEPATWAMMIVGLGAAGATMRRSARRGGKTNASRAANA